MSNKMSESGLLPGDSRRERELDSRAVVVISGLRGGCSGPRIAPINLSAPGHFGQQSGVHPVALGLFRAAAFVCGEAEENYIRCISS